MMGVSRIEPVNEPVETATGPSLYLVDDEHELLMTLADSLRSLGHEPRTFERPDDLLRATRDGETGCVVTDLRMPGIGGVELIKSLKQRESCLSTILLTAYADVPTAVDVMKLGAVSVVEKPFDLRVLSSEIDAAMRVSHQVYLQRRRVREAKRRLAELNDEERSVLDYAVGGCANREIARRMSLSPRTVDRRRQSALRKLATESIAEYAVLKTRAGA